ncbi:unnamed protein product [Mytilus coruscus]|uniref:Uncharacterized protein n=1 Tax=Mytilus coruscus TaxID=42192 RepID=A0A6J8A4W5_MYTCO|nr:unnamed protein product [Mytilus coruscus]
MELCEIFDLAFIDPFDISDAPEHLVIVNIATGSVAPKCIETSLSNALETGLAMMKKFVKERLLDTDLMNTQRKSLYDSLPKSTVKTLTEMKKSEKMTSIDRCNALIYDGHAVIQMLNPPSRTVVPTTFEDMANWFFDTIFSHSRHSNNDRPVKQIHIVFERYLEESIKEQTREKRTAGILVSQPTNKRVISSPDTDVLVLLIHHRQSIAAENVYFLTGRVVFMVKRTVFSLDSLRCEKANKSVPAKKLPPTENSFKQVLRCIHQLKIWHSANTAMHEQVNPIMYGYGRDLETDTIMPRLMSQPAAAPELLNNLICECDEHNCSEICTCLENEQACSATYSCGASADIADETTCNTQ